MSASSEQYAAGITDAIFAYNTGREPALLAMKYAKMSQSPFVFLRGACHLFYDTLPDSPFLREAPLAWCCGDLHFENFGSYKGDNSLVYFDIDDYDEAALAPFTWDMVRLLTSIQCGADTLRATPAEAQEVSRTCLDAYRQALARGKPLWIERETSVGLVNELLTNLQGRERADFLDKRTTRKAHRRSLIVDGVKALPASEAQRKAVIEFMAGFAAAQPKPNFFDVIDVARRIAGTGSLGVDRYVVLVEGKGSSNGNYLLDIKEAKPSALVPRLAQSGIKQPEWKDEASRVVAVQNLMQAADRALLYPVQLDGQSCILKRLQPSEDRVSIGEWGKKLDRLKEVVATMGRILAWDQLRASGRSGAASADELSAYALRTDWTPEMLEATNRMALLTRQQWQAFAQVLGGQSKRPTS
jgi:uncharacterized protein (DUF2252 family)